MSTWSFRTRPGVGDDVVYETRLWWLRWLPNRLNLGWYAYANAASARNRHIAKLNAFSVKVDAELNLWAGAEAKLAAEQTESKDSSHNHLGISKVFPMDPKSIKEMLPFMDEPKSTFRTIISEQYTKKILKQHNVQANKPQQNNAPGSPTDYDMVISTAHIDSPGVYDGARHVMQWTPPQENKNSSGNAQNKSGGNPSKEDWKRGRQANPRHDGEEQGPWDKRVKRWLGN